MTEWIITSSALIGIVIGLRFLTNGKISMRLRYGLWALVLVRLLIPISIPSSLSIMNLLPEPAVSEAPAIQTDHLPQYQQPAYVTPEPLPSLPAMRPQPAVKPQIQPNTQEKEPSVTPISLARVLSGLWIAGMVMTSCVLLFSNVHFALKLKRSRNRIHITGYKIPIYQSAILSTPCVHGLIFPKIYLTTESLGETQTTHILTHEMTHLRHGDPLWSLLRCVCLALHWYNPLVWVAAVLSRQDAELACDEAAIRRLGEEQRSAYGQTLLHMACTRSNGKGLLLTASTMHTTKNLLKERIFMIAKKPRNTALALLLFVLVAAIAVGCTMTGSKQNVQSDNAPAASQAITFQEEKAIYIRHNGGFGSDFTVTLYEDGRFKYYEGNLSSYIGYGNWTLDDDILTLIDDNQNREFKNLFRVMEGNLTWMAAGSTGFTYGSYISMADGDIFFRQSPKPAQLSYMTDLAYLPQDYMDGGPLGCFLHVDGITYVWDHNVTGTLQDMQAEEIGSVAHRDDTVIPETQLSACRIPEGTVLYKGKDAGKSKYEAIYYKLEGFDLYARMLPTDAYRGADRWWESQTAHMGSQSLTLETLRKLQVETGKLLSKADLHQYSYIAFPGKNAFDYRLYQVDADYRLLLISGTTVADVEAFQARFYHKDLPHYWVDLMTTGIYFYQSNLTTNEVNQVSETEVVYEAEGFVTAESLKRGVPCKILLEKNCEGARHLNTQLVVTSPAGTIRQTISHGIGPIIPDGERLYLADLDGDNICEILLQEDLGGNGGYGAYRCRVFKVDNNTITAIFDVDSENDLNTGFYWEICDNFKFIIHNRITGDYWEIEADQYRRDYYFDGTGKIAVEDPEAFQLWADSFYEFYPRDIDGDGIYEICTTQYTWDITHVDGVGDVKCVFKYDTASGSFRIIETDFVQYME